MATTLTTGAAPTEATDPSAEPPARRRRHRRWREVVTPASIVTFGLVALAVLFTLSQLRPRLLLTGTTPAGGDMGAHVWGPAYLRDVLLPSGKLSGWTADWYAGFPAYQFYMVVPVSSRRGRNCERVNSTARATRPKVTIEAGVTTSRQRR